MNLLDRLTEDLRLALLLLGAVLLLSILVWELVQRWRAKRADDTHQVGPLGQARDAAGPVHDPLLRGREANDEWAVGPAAAGAALAAGNSGAAGTSTVEGAAAAASTSAAARGVNEPELTLPELRVRDRLVEPSIVDLDSAVSERSESSLPLLDANSWPTPSVAEAASPAQHSDVAELPSAAQARTDEEPTDAIAAVQQPAEGPRLNWPPEEARRIVALRVTARNGERFTGASLRQALLGEGFVLGELDIFHRPLADGRVLLSAASLTRPGGFDLNTMDSTLFLGLNLFAVLPGPMPGRDTVDKLLLAGHTLAQRLRGELRDSAGEVLTEVRLAEMRREAASADG